jgi:hypothetical protein
LRGREEKPAYTQQELMALVKFWQQKYIQHNTIAEGQSLTRIWCGIVLN